MEIIVICPLVMPESLVFSDAAQNQYRNDTQEIHTTCPSGYALKFVNASADLQSALISIGFAILMTNELF